MQKKEKERKRGRKGEKKREMSFHFYDCRETDTVSIILSDLRTVHSYCSSWNYFARISHMRINYTC